MKSAHDSTNPTLANEAVVRVDTTIYEIDAIFRASYRLTDRCFLRVGRDREVETIVVVTLRPKSQDLDLANVEGEFLNELVDQQIRQRLSRDAGNLRDLIVAEAFAEGNLLDPDRDVGNPSVGPNTA